MKKVKYNNTGEEYICKFDWSNEEMVILLDMFIEKEKKILFKVITRKINYNSFEGIKKVSFVDGLGDTFEEAEKDAWEKFGKYIECDHPKFERRGAKHGSAYCTKCNLFAPKVFEPSEKCEVCGKITFFMEDKDGKFYCEEHANQIEPSKKTDKHKIAECMNLIN
jgi:hypothetical protein